MSKAILFLSVTDFTDKGIQVVKFTPEYFARQGWRVFYAVTRDNSKHGSYFYQEVVNPVGVTVVRSEMPWLRLGELLNSHTLKTIYSKLRGYAAILKLIGMGYNIVKRNKIDVLYGGGPHGVLSAYALRILFPLRQFLLVSRFYGLWDLYSRAILGKKWYRLLLNLDLVVALYLRPDLMVITNDGTQGNKAAEFIRKSNKDIIRFYPNGVDSVLVSNAEVCEIKKRYALHDGFTAIAVTRLIPLKRVDLCIKVLHAVVFRYGYADFKLLVVGEGYDRKRLEKLVVDLKLERNVCFVGAVSNSDVRKYLSAADYFISVYEVSNVGNPLLEAIRSHKIIFTLNNGDTANWIRHQENGFIYAPDTDFVGAIAADIVKLFANPSLLLRLKKGISDTAATTLRTWDQRLESEVTEIERMLPPKAI